MPRRQLTDRFCDHAKTDGQQIDYFDEAVSGLALRVSPTKKAWTWLYTRGGKRKRLTFATYPATSLASARAKVDLMRQEIEAGRDPLPQAETFKAICEEYLRRCRLRTKADRQRCLERLVWPVFGSRPIGEIRRSEIVRLLDGIEDANGSVMADRTLALVRTIMNYHASRSDDFRSPIVKGMARTKPKERQRERTLTDDELRSVWAAASGVFGSMVKFYRLRGTRLKSTWCGLSVMLLLPSYQLPMASGCLAPMAKRQSAASLNSRSALIGSAGSTTTPFTIFAERRGV